MFVRGNLWMAYFLNAFVFDGKNCNQASDLVTLTNFPIGRFYKYTVNVLYVS